MFFTFSVRLVVSLGAGTCNSIKFEENQKDPRGEEEAVRLVVGEEASRAAVAAGGAV